MVPRLRQGLSTLTSTLAPTPPGLNPVKACDYGQSLPQLRFQVLLTLSPEFFASFAHATCALSVNPPIFSFRWYIPPI